MNMINNFDDRVWDRFFEFVFPDEKELTRKEVQTDLRRAGIDMRRSVGKLHALLKQTREAQDARAALETAKRTRPSVLAKLMNIDVPLAPAIREKLKNMIANRLSGPQQAVYARKLDSAASDDDLRSLLEDLSRLDAFLEDGDDGAR